MSKVKTSAWGLKFGHPTPFRQTVTVGEGKAAERVQLVFEPDTKYELTDQEVAGIQPFVDSGLLVPWSEDPKERRSPKAPLGNARGIEAGNRNAQLEHENAELAQHVAILIQQVKELGGVPNVELVDEEATDEADEESHDKPNRRRGRRGHGDE